MRHTDARAFVSVKFSPAGRTVSFLLPEIVVDEEPTSDLRPETSDLRPLLPGDQVVVETVDGQALGTVTRVPQALAERRAPAADSTQVVVRRASHDDVVQRLQQQHREVDAQRVAQLKIRERGLAMK